MKQKTKKNGRAGKPLALRRVVRSKGFFVVLALLCILMLVLFITSRISFLAAQTNKAFNRDDAGGSALRFDIEGFQNLNLIRP